MLPYFVQYQSITDKSDTTSIPSTVGIPSGVGWVSNGHFGCGRFGRLSSQSQNRQRFNGNVPQNKIVAITDLILINMHIKHYILHLCTPEVIVLTTREINLPVVAILMDTAIMDNWDREHIIQAVEVLDVEVTLPKLLLLFLLFTFNRLPPRMFCLMPFLQWLMLTPPL